MRSKPIEEFGKMNKSCLAIFLQSTYSVACTLKMLLVSTKIPRLLGNDVTLDELSFAVPLLAVGEKQTLMSKRFQPAGSYEST